jgi:rhodanese-related sulfurtransferase
VPEIAPAEAARLLAEGAAGICLEPSASYRQAHPPGAVWSTRPRLDRLPPATLKANPIVLFSADSAAARLAAADLAELGGSRIALVSGGTQAWSNAGLPVVASPDNPPDADRVDYLFWNHDRHAGNREAMQAYLRWETELPDQIAADGLAGFKLGLPLSQ